MGTGRITLVFFLNNYLKSMLLTGQYRILVKEPFLVLPNQCLQCRRVNLIFPLITVMTMSEDLSKDSTPLTPWPFFGNCVNWPSRVCTGFLFFWLPAEQSANIFGCCPKTFRSLLWCTLKTPLYIFSHGCAWVMLGVAISNRAFITWQENKIRNERSLISLNICS